MERKANIIKCLKMMGYSVIDYGSMYKVVLETHNGLIFETYVSYLQLDQGNYTVETIVNQINTKIINYTFKEVSE